MFLFQVRVSCCLKILHSNAIYRCHYSPTIGFVYLEEGDRGDFYTFNNGWVLDNLINPEG